MSRSRQKFSPVARPRSETAQHPYRQWLVFAVIAIALFALTLITFFPVISCGFVNFDDDQYITANGIVQQGLTWRGVIWAFTSTPLKLWHPLSFVSLMCDVELFGLDPRGYHAVNLLFHAVNVVLLFALLQLMTRSLWRSAIVSALFAIHPLRVESVAWVSERKDVLEMFFGLLSLLAYVAYARRPAVWKYVLIAVPFTLSLLCKPVWVTLPGLLLLLDFWPLARLPDWKSAGRRVLEKLPLLLIALVVVITIHWFAEQGSKKRDDAYVQPAAERREMVVISYLRYLEKMADFSRLAVLYPIRPPPAAWKIVAAGLLLAAVTALSLANARRRPWLIVGWCWYVAALLPVIGIERQVGFHSMADRYMYLPCIGLLIAILWSVPERWMRPGLRGAGAVVLGGVIVTLCFFTRRQIGYWHDSVTLFQHAAAVTENNDFAEYSLGCAYWRERHDAADSINHFEAALRLRPDLTSAHTNLAVVLIAENQPLRAIAHYREALIYDPECPKANDGWGCALARMEDQGAAVKQFQRAVEVDPTDVAAHLHLGITFIRLKRYDEAVAALLAAQELAPEDGQILAELRHAEDLRRQ